MKIKKFINTDLGVAKYDKKRGRYYIYNLPLHRVVYNVSIGSVPDGCEIHHIDGNKFNNKIDNLVAISKDEHRKIHEKNNLKAVKVSKILMNSYKEAKQSKEIKLTK